MNKLIENILYEIDQLLSTYSFGKIIKDGVNVVLVGKPNVGKSSLLNYILKESRAIVSSIPGTTRDIIREEASVDGFFFRFFDTAGIRFSNNEIEKEGVLRSRRAVKEADIVIFLNDIEDGISYKLMDELLSLTKKEKIITVLNKIDKKKYSLSGADAYISAKTGEGIEDLLNKLKIMVIGTENYSEKSAIVSSMRHYNCLRDAKNALLNAKDSISNNLSGEFISVDLRSAENYLGEIIGQVTTDDILNNIFGKFCIGK